MSFLSRYMPFVAAMALVVVASNVLVQFPMQGTVAGLSLADILTWGAFTYPFSFLVTDLANRRYGPAVARRIVFVGFMTAVVCSIVVPPLLFRLGLVGFETQAARLARIAMASGAAFALRWIRKCGLSTASASRRDDLIAARRAGRQWRSRTSACTAWCESSSTTMNSTGSRVKTSAKPICSATKPMTEGAKSAPE